MSLATSPLNSPGAPSTRGFPLQRGMIGSVVQMSTASDQRRYHVPHSTYCRGIVRPASQQLKHVDHLDIRNTQATKCQILRT